MPRRTRLLAAGSGVVALAAVVGYAGLASSPSQAGTPSRAAVPVVADWPAAELPAAPAPLDPSRRPNIVFVLADDLTWDLVPYLPNVRALARAGVTFSRYVVSNSLCCPSRASILTGRYPHTTGVWNNTGDHGGYGAFTRADRRHTYAVALHRAGYRTALVGKYLNGYQFSHDRSRRSSPIAPGWDEWYVSDGTGYRQFDYWLNVNGRARHYGHQPADYGTDVLAQLAAGFISRAAGTGQPFMLTVAPFSPHLPDTPAPRYRTAFGWAQVPRGPEFNAANVAPPRWLQGIPVMSAADIAQADEQFRRRVRAAAAVDDLLGRLRDTLERTGQGRNTYVLFSSDNGYHLGEHRIWGGKRTAFDTDVLVPTMVTGPGVPRGRTVEALTSNVDVAPTFGAMAGVSPDRTAEGRSLLPWLQGHQPAHWRTAVLVDYLSSTIGGSDPDEQSPGSGLPPRYRALRLSDGLFVQYVNGDREFYDLGVDPHELVNVWATLPQSRKTALEHQLAGLGHCRSVECRSADSVR